MKKIYLAIGALLTASSFAQTMNENFESWTVGSYMGDNSVDWTTWSGTTGGAEDVQVTDVDASEGTKSIYFSTSSASGGPQDVVVPFGGEYNTGQFFFESMMKVESGKGAYFNFQATNTPGEIWSLNMSFIQDGSLIMDDGIEVLMETSYPTDTWFKVTIDVNLNTNDWELLIDDVSQGVVANGINQVASIDIYPVNANYGGNNLAGYYMDEFQFDHTAYTLPAENLGVINITNTNGLATAEVNPTVIVRNLGTSTITSFDVELTYNGATISESVTGVSIPSLDSYEVDFADIISLIAGPNDAVATITNVNGSAGDGDASDDSKTKTINPVVPAAGKMVVGEEGTGTWCGWCPRGAVYMDLMEERYGDFWAGIAVHNGDPMVYEPYDSGIGALISGYPSALVDRGGDIDPSGMENEFLNEIVLAPDAYITNGATYDATTGKLMVSVKAEFITAVSGNYKLACVITEDSVTGTGSGWNQANYYAGGGSGVMGGYEVLPNPVPASQMVYDHVARIILPSFGGYSGLIPTSVTSGDTYIINFEITVPSGWNPEKLHIIGMLIDPTGKIENADKATIDEAVANGFESSETVVAGINEEVLVENNINLYPNPTNNVAFLNLDLNTESNVSIDIFNMSGQLVANKNYGQLVGNYQFPIDVNAFETGVYTIQININGNITTKKLIVK